VGAEIDVMLKRRRLLTARAVAVILVVAATSGAGLASARDSGARGTDQRTVGALLDPKAGWTSLGHASRVTLRIAAPDANAGLAKSWSVCAGGRGHIVARERC
jgi:hypothetical protein